MTHRRRRDEEEDDAVREIRYVVRQELSHQIGLQSLRKNGGSWKDWAQRVVTPDRILWLAMAIFVLGGRVEKYTGDINAALASTSTLKSDIEDLKIAVENQDKLIRAQTDESIKQETMHATKTDVAKLGDQLSLTITRQEWNSVWRTQIVPRLERIEQRLP